MERSAGDPICFDYQRLHWDGEPTDHPIGIFVGVVADFAMTVDGQLIYSEIDFCIAEFAVQARDWLASDAQAGRDFIYTSIEADEPGLVWFRNVGSGLWLPGSIWQDHPSPRPVPFDDLAVALRHFYASLQSDLAGSPYGVDLNAI